MFLYPPRPEQAVPRAMLPFFEDRGYVAQIKKNGTCSMVWIDRAGKPTFYTRHGEAHKAWKPSRETCAFLGQYRNTALIFELLHSKGGGVRDTLYFFDALVADANDLYGMKLNDRLHLLRGMINDKAPDNMSVTVNHESNFQTLFDGLVDPLDEGLVLKDPNARLGDCYRAGRNGDWQVKCRRPTKNYGF